MEATFYYNGMAGAPSLPSAAAGNMIALLDACLVNGFNSGATTLTGAGTSVTASRTAHGFKFAQLVTISGANEAAYNGTFRVTAVPDANTFTYTAVSTPSASPATGSISSKTPALGWTKEFTGTNLAAYRPAVGNRRYLRVDDTPTYNSIIVGYDAMSDVNTGTGLFPATALVAANGLRWPKPTTGSSNSWFVCGDDRRFYIMSSSYNLYQCFGFFGDMPSWKSGDTGNTVLMGVPFTSDTNAMAMPGNSFSANNFNSNFGSGGSGYVMYQDYTGTLAVGATQALPILYVSTGTVQFCSASGAMTPFPYGGNPSPITGGYFAMAIELMEKSGSYVSPRFRMPGLFNICNTYDPNANNRAILTSAGPFAYAIVQSMYYTNTSYTGLPFALGDWQTQFATGV